MRQQCAYMLGNYSCLFELAISYNDGEPMMENNHSYRRGVIFVIEFDVASVWVCVCV